MGKNITILYPLVTGQNIPTGETIDRTMAHFFSSRSDNVPLKISSRGVRRDLTEQAHQEVSMDERLTAEVQGGSEDSMPSQPDMEDLRAKYIALQATRAGLPSDTPRSHYTASGKLFRNS